MYNFSFCHFSSLIKVEFGSGKERCLLKSIFTLVLGESFKIGGVRKIKLNLGYLKYSYDKTKIKIEAS